VIISSAFHETETLFLGMATDDGQEAAMNCTRKLLSREFVPVLSGSATRRVLFETEGVCGVMEINTAID
jgi:hypothetical protein